MKNPLLTTAEVPTLVRSHDQALAYDFGYYVRGQRTATKDDMKIQYEYVNDMKFTLNL